MSDIKTYICDNKERLDIFLASEIGQTRSQIAQLIKQECVYLDDKLITRPGVKLKPTESILVEFP